MLKQDKSSKCYYQKKWYLSKLKHIWSCFVTDSLSLVWRFVWQMCFHFVLFYFYESDFFIGWILFNSSGRNSTWKIICFICFTFRSRTFLTSYLQNDIHHTFSLCLSPTCRSLKIFFFFQVKMELNFFANLRFIIAT